MRGYKRDVSLPQVVRQNAAEMVQACLARAISKSLKRWNTETVDAADIDNSRRIHGLCGLFHEWSEKTSDIEDTVKVQS